MGRSTKPAKTAYQKQKAHAKRRAKERYGLTLYNEDLEFMVKQIKVGEAQRIEGNRETNRISFWAVLYRGQWLPVMYDGSRCSIATILPPHALLQSDDSGDVAASR